MPIAQFFIVMFIYGLFICYVLYCLRAAYFIEYLGFAVVVSTLSILAEYYFGYSDILLIIKSATLIFIFLDFITITIALVGRYFSLPPNTTFQWWKILYLPTIFLFPNCITPSNLKEQQKNDWQTITVKRK